MMEAGNPNDGECEPRRSSRKPKMRKEYQDFLNKSPRKAAKLNYTDDIHMYNSIEDDEEEMNDLSVTMDTGCNKTGGDDDCRTTVALVHGDPILTPNSSPKAEQLMTRKQFSPLGHSKNGCIAPLDDEITFLKSIRDPNAKLQKPTRPRHPIQTRSKAPNREVTSSRDVSGKLPIDANPGSLLDTSLEHTNNSADVPTRKRRGRCCSLQHAENRNIVSTSKGVMHTPTKETSNSKQNVTSKRRHSGLCQLQRIEAKQSSYTFLPLNSSILLRSSATTDNQSPSVSGFRSQLNTNLYAGLLEDFSSAIVSPSNDLECLTSQSPDGSFSAIPTSPNGTTLKRGKGCATVRKGQDAHTPGDSDRAVGMNSSSDQLSTISEQKAVNDSAQGRVIKKRGRPRKYKPADQLSTSTVPNVKKVRGRPKKIQKSETSEIRSVQGESAADSLVQCTNSEVSVNECFTDTKKILECSTDSRRNGDLKEMENELSIVNDVKKESANSTMKKASVDILEQDCSTAFNSNSNNSNGTEKKTSKSNEENTTGFTDDTVNQDASVDNEDEEEFSILDESRCSNKCLDDDEPVFSSTYAFSNKKRRSSGVYKPLYTSFLSSSYTTDNSLEEDKDDGDAGINGRENEDMNVDEDNDSGDVLSKNIVDNTDGAEAEEMAVNDSDVTKPKQQREQKVSAKSVESVSSNIDDAASEEIRSLPSYKRQKNQNTSGDGEKCESAGQSLEDEHSKHDECAFLHGNSFKVKSPEIFLSAETDVYDVQPTKNTVQKASENRARRCILLPPMKKEENDDSVEVNDESENSAFVDLNNKTQNKCPDNLCTSEEYFLQIDNMDEKVFSEHVKSPF
uniref:Dentin sialophosphoprotein-like n=1 Tax=Saccoglossus kowalevskii TaxID=10224 RepID=A0ABM0LYD5_SACKO|nr:PREDICTED: dentin sialophosphoprotein-like [Saccoglossus kowalevskii]